MEDKFSKRSFLAVAFGTMVEYYDFTIFGIFLPIIAPIFFPAATAYDSLIKGFYAMLIASIARPLGGIFFGHLGDRFGRRKALLASMYGIALATILMGLTPSYSMIGAWAILILIITKAIQGLCFGGEFNGAGIYVTEHAKPRNEALMSSMLVATTLAGSLLSTFVGFLTTLEGMPIWSWRVAFVVGGIIGIAGILFRKNLQESPNFAPAHPKSHNFAFMIKKFPFQLLAGVFIGGFATVPFTTVFAFINPVLMTNNVISSQVMMLLNCGLIIIAIISLMIAGTVADKKTPHQVMLFGAIALALSAFPLLWLVDQGNFKWILLAQGMLVIVNEIFLGPAHACLKNLFPMQFRYRGASLSFTLGMSVFGSFTPLMANYLYRATGAFSSISIWLVFIGLGSFFTLRLAIRKQHTQMALDLPQCLHT